MPVILARDVFIILDIVLLYVSTTDWGTTTQEAVAFLLVIFGQLANLWVFFIVAWGAWSIES